MLENLRELWEKGCTYFGLSERDDANETATPVSSDRTEYVYPRFSDELPYRYYDEETQLFHNTHSSGLVYSISPLTGGNEAVAEELDALIRTKISDDFTLQVIQVKHNQVAPRIDRFAAQFEQDNLGALANLGTSLERYYKNAALNGFKTRDELKTRLTQTDVYLIVDVKNRNVSESDLKVRFTQFRIEFEAALTASHIGFHVCDAVDFLHLLYFYTQHSVDSIYPRTVDYQDDTLLKYQTCGRSFMLEVDEKQKDHLRLSGDDEQGRAYTTAISVLTLDKMPSEYHLWDNINNTANIFSPDYTLNCNSIISVTYRVDEQGKALAKAQRKTRDLDKKTKSDYALKVPGTEKQAAQWKSFRDDLDAQKTRSVKMLYNVVLFSREEDLAKDVQKAINTFRVNGLKIALCKRMQVPYFLSCMPFQFTGNLQYDFSLPTMMHHISSWNATQYLPLLADWQGQKKGVLLPSMRGQFSLLDPFSGYFGTNYNVAVTGQSGAGKSFLMQMMMLTTFFDGGYVYIVDIGGSYRKLCETLGGIYLEYHNLAMNPFTHVTNLADNIDALIDLFELLACPKNLAKDEDAAALRMAIISAFEAHGQNTLIDHVQSALNALYEPNKYPTARILAANLDRYTSTAEHGKAFNEPSKLDPNARFIVVDLQEIKDKKNLIAPALLTILNEYHKRIFSSDRSIKKLCVVDEAWKFLKGDLRAIEFLAEGFRTGRRHNAAFVTITQGINDYFDFEAAMQLWENASLKLIFLQDEATLTAFNKKYDMLSEYEISLLKKFPDAKEVGYSHVHVRGSGLNSFHRLFVDPYTLVMLSSAGADYSAVEKLRANGLTLQDAIATVAREHYGDMYGE